VGWDTEIASLVTRSTLNPCSPNQAQSSSRVLICSAFTLAMIASVSVALRSATERGILLTLRITTRRRSGSLGDP